MFFINIKFIILKLTISSQLLYDYYITKIQLSQVKLHFMQRIINIIYVNIMIVYIMFSLSSIIHTLIVCAHGLG